MRKYLSLPAWLLRAVLAALLPVADGLIHPRPAHAVFFENARVWLNELFLSTGNLTAAFGVDMTVNVLRAVLLVWIALGIVRTVQAARNDEDWQTTARVPILATISIVVGDVITSLIIPSA
ncbi:hypothetical protein [Gloeobacter violaceus]|uniref:Gll0619 protein n=1 Tax=Gloeobacter violaceus (strain ATCC 29082 / PCC 7421) TaxID=251221 RepID=Q7NMZ6_GLOVI|nr:hypothetical protein [Gloeobacter violaceus]BAC88560.1 gll0619 [Gloeobacter violaceus PCC 7421]